MSVFDTTSAVVKTWAKLQTSPFPTDRLEVLWSSIEAPFYPDACRDLVKKIYAAFPGATNLKSDLKYQQIKDSVANTGGNIDTVDDLSDAIAESLTAREVVFLTPMTRGLVPPGKTKNTRSMAKRIAKAPRKASNSGLVPLGKTKNTRSAAEVAKAPRKASNK